MSTEQISRRVRLGIPTPGESTDMRLYGAEGVLAIGHREDGGYYNELLNFYEAVVFDEPIVGTIAQSYRNLGLIMGALDSAEQQRVVEISAPPGVASGGTIPLWRPRGARGLFDGLPCRIERHEST